MLAFFYILCYLRVRVHINAHFFAWVRQSYRRVSYRRVKRYKSFPECASLLPECIYELPRCIYKNPAIHLQKNALNSMWKVSHIPRQSEGDPHKKKGSPICSQASLHSFNYGGLAWCAISSSLSPLTICDLLAVP